MREPTWGFLTNHFYVLRAIAGEPSPTLRQMAARIGITERAVQRIVAELEEAGYLLRKREGRRNRYLVREGQRRHELDAALPLRELLGLDGLDTSPRVVPRESVARDPSFID